MLASFALLVAGALVAQVLVFMAFIIHHQRLGDTSAPAELVSRAMRSPLVVLGAMAFSALLPLLFAFLFARPRPWRDRLLLSPPARFGGYALLLSLAAVGIAEVNALIIHSHGRDAWGGQVHAVILGLAKQSGGPLALFWLLAIFLGPFGEELFFRGLLQPRFVARWGARAGVLATCLLFALIHMNLSQSFNAFGLGLVLGWGTLRCRSIWPGAVAHAAVNALAVTNLRFRSPSPPTNFGDVASTLGLAFGLLESPTTLG